MIYKYIHSREYDEDYELGQRYCQNASCSNHLQQHHFAQMKKMRDFYFCSLDCMQCFYERNRDFIEYLIEHNISDKELIAHTLKVKNWGKLFRL